MKVNSAREIDRVWQKRDLFASDGSRKQVEKSWNIPLSSSALNMEHRSIDNSFRNNVKRSLGKSIHSTLKCNFNI